MVPEIFLNCTVFIFIFLGLFIWKKQHELCLLKEVTCVEPYAKKQSDRVAAWRTIASNPNGNKQGGFKVTERSCRDRFKRIMEEFENKEQVEKKAFGIDAEYDELDQLCQDIKERMEEVSSQEEAESAKKKSESEKAASMRQMAMETVAETKKRKSTGGAQPPRRRGADTMQFLQESHQIRSQQLKAEQALRERELQLKEAELRQTQQQQQQQQQLMLQMLQQLTDIIKTDKSSLTLVFLYNKAL